MARPIVAFAGTADIAARILDGIRGDCEPVLVISQPDRPAGRGRTMTPPPLAQYASEHDLRLIQPERIDDDQTVSLLRELGVDTIIVVAFGQLIREPLLSDFLLINVHVSALPAYRGAAPIERAIMDGQEETGISIMRLDEGMDTGPVAEIVPLTIGENDTAGDIYERSIDAGIHALSRTLTAVGEQTIEFVDQDHSRASHAAKIGTEDKMLDPATLTAQEMHDRVRALSPHIGAFCFVDGKRLGVWETRTTGDQQEPGSIVIHEDTVTVGCADGQATALVSVQPAGKKRMDAIAWANGLQQAPSAVSGSGN